MKKNIFLFSCFLTVLALVLIDGGLIGKADARQDDVHIISPWAKPNYGPNGAVYFTIHNHGKQPLHLVSASSPLSTRVEIHEHVHEKGVMKMRKVKGDLEILSLDLITFEPGGLHVMLFNMKKKLKVGDELPLTLKFRDGTETKLKVKVSKTAPDGTESKHEHHHHN